MYAARSELIKAQADDPLREAQNARARRLWLEVIEVINGLNVRSLTRCLAPRTKFDGSLRSTGLVVPGERTYQVPSSYGPHQDIPLLST